MPDSFIRPRWSAPANVHAWTTTRMGGVSSGVYSGFNLALHVNDDPDNVASNRAYLASELALPAEPGWLQQVHGSDIVRIDQAPGNYTADGSMTGTQGPFCVVMTADCLPVLLCNRSGTAVAALHAGWRGLAAGILEKGVEMMPKDDAVLAWMGPAIGPDRFEVGEEVIEQLEARDDSTSDWYRPADGAGKYFVDIYQLARYRLIQSGVEEVSGGGLCTFTDDRYFFSYRRQGQCGRMASLVWLGPPVGCG